MALSEDQVLSAFEASLGQSQEAPQQPADAKAPPAVESKQEQSEVATEQPAEEVKDEEHQEEQQDVQTLEIDPDEPLFEQQLEDKTTRKLSLKELQQGYLRQSDYTRKTQELAAQRAELPKEIAKREQESSSSYVKRLSELSALVLRTVAPELQGVDLNKLANEDPYEYVRLSNRSSQIQQLLQTIRAEQAAEESKQSQHKQKEDNERWEKSLPILQRDIPDFGPEVVKRLIEAGKQYDYAPEEVAKWVDHRQVKMLYALMSKDEAAAKIESKRPEIEKKVALVTKIVKPGQSTKTRTATDEARAKLRKSGKLDDALPVFEAMIR